MGGIEKALIKNINDNDISKFKQLLGSKTTQKYPQEISKALSYAIRSYNDHEIFPDPALGSSQFIIEAINAGANINQVDNHGNNPLSLTIDYCNNLKIFDLILNHPKLTLTGNGHKCLRDIVKDLTNSFNCNIGNENKNICLLNKAPFIFKLLNKYEELGIKLPKDPAIIQALEIIKSFKGSCTFTGYKRLPNEVKNIIFDFIPNMVQGFDNSKRFNLINLCNKQLKKEDFLKKASSAKTIQQSWRNFYKAKEKQIATRNKRLLKY